MKRIFKNRSVLGFTLTEVVIVVIVVGILASLLLPQFSIVVERNISSEGVQIITALLGSQTRYELENGAYTNNIADLDITIPASQNFNPPTVNSVNPLASIQRNTGAYTLSIDDNGTINCTSATGICTKLGY